MKTKSNQMNNFQRIFFVFGILLAFGILLIASLDLYGQINFFRNSVTITGTVTQIKQNNDRNEIHYIRSIKYIDDSGEQRELINTETENNLKIGDKVKVNYNYGYGQIFNLDDLLWPDLYFIIFFSIWIIVVVIVIKNSIAPIKRIR
jgi:hypothetical protein